MRITLFTGILAWVACSTLLAETNVPVYLGIDAKGGRHEVNDAVGNAAWMRDLAYTRRPSFPFGDARSGYQGVGIFRLTIEPGTGGTSKVAILRSTGHVSFDRSALLALKLWRWKPGTWTQVDVPVFFRPGGGVIVFPHYDTVPVRQRN
jgi:TonB family protein